LPKKSKSSSVPTFSREEWIKAFDAEYLRRVGLTEDDRGVSTAELYELYHLFHSPAEAVTAQMEKYDLDDVSTFPYT
jgi:hypothetical protein